MIVSCFSLTPMCLGITKDMSLKIDAEWELKSLWSDFAGSVSSRRSRDKAVAVGCDGKASDSF